VHSHTGYSWGDFSETKPLWNDSPKWTFLPFYTGSVWRASEGIHRSWVDLRVRCLICIFSCWLVILMVSKKWRIDFSQFSSANSMHVKMLESCACLLPGDFPDVLLCVYIFLIATCLRTCLVGGTVSKYVVVQWLKIDTNTDTSSSSSINALAVLASGVRRWVLRTVLTFHSIVDFFKLCL